MNFKSCFVIGIIACCLSACSTLKGSSTLSNNEASATNIGSASESVTSAEGGLVASTDPLAQRSFFFGFDSSVIQVTDQSIITNHATYLKEQPQIHVKLQGNTDSRGSREYNLALGQRRAESVRQALILLGVNPDQLEAISFGMEQLRALGTTEADHAQNRRVDIVY